MDNSYKGILHPARLPRFSRLPAPPDVQHLVSWFWIPEWDIAPGRSSRQHLIAYAACNLVVQREGMELSGPSTKASHRDLSGKGWAVGALLRPAAVPSFTDSPGELRDGRLWLDASDLHAAVTEAMGKNSPTRGGEAAALLAGWLLERVPSATDEALLANAMTEAIANDPELVRIADVAQRLSVSTRTLQRLAAKYVGLSPSALIRRRRLQEAASQLRTQPDVDLAVLAARFGYADQAHLSNDFRRYLGLTPGRYQKSAGYHL